MADFTREELLEIIRNARKLRGADLKNLDLSGADLRKANMMGADLRLSLIHISEPTRPY